MISRSFDTYSPHFPFLHLTSVGGTVTILASGTQ